ncbi:MAG: hypothetical protein KDD83_29260, partial [Caldilineaceae bacterium]|nr:hypothetical protein [Caldilineaceae bacterium]
SWAASAYTAFWQAYNGQIEPTRLTQLYGYLPGTAWKLLLTLLAGGKWMTRQDGGFQLTATGRNRYHDLERWVTYRFIEPLWTEMMQEHAAG